MMKKKTNMYGINGEKRESVRYTWQCQEEIETVIRWDENETKMIGGSIYNRGVCCRVRL